jgi:endonuclease III
MQSTAILEVAGEGGCLAVFGEQSEAGDWHFWTSRDETAAYDCLSDDDREGINPLETTGFVNSLHEALKAFDRYPWHCLYPTVIDPRFEDAIYMEVKTRSTTEQAALWQELVGRIRAGHGPGPSVSTQEQGAFGMDDIKDTLDDRMHRIAAALLENRTGTDDWGELSHLEGQPCSKKVANKFLICCLLDYQMDSDLVWRNGYRLVEEILGDPDDVWAAITSASEAEWESKRDQYHLHRFPSGHDRLWHIARRICANYDGDARLIWKGKDSSDVVERLWSVGAGEEISRMIAGALRDCGQISGVGDVKADVHVCRVLGRAVYGDQTDSEAALQLARQLYPSDPWQLDWPIWELGRTHCHVENPSCSQCYLAPHCAYALRALPRSAVASDNAMGT